MRQITETTFYQFIKCPNWVYFDAHAGEGKPHDPLLLRLMQDGLVDEAKRHAISDRPDVAEVTAEDPDEAFRQTLAFMREGRATIYGGVLVDKHWVGHPDMLARVEGTSVLGSHYYVAADVKRTREVRDEYKFQGCFYAELLAKIQGTKPTQGYVITPNGDALAYSIEDFETEYKLALDDIEAIVAGKRPVHFVTGACKQSPWFSECRLASHACNELSVLNRVWNEEVLRLAEAGVATVEDLASRSVADLARLCPGIHPGRMGRLRDQAVAIRDRHHVVLAPVRLPSSAIEVYFDVESDPLRDFDYLFGALAVRGGKETYYPFLARKPEDEGKAWAEFAAFVESHLDAPIYHYGWFEREVVNRFAAKYGCSEIAREALDRNMVDLMEVIRASVIFPLTFYSLKDIAAYVGFSWRSEDASGANSVLWFESWLKNGDRATLDKILAYNEDDVRATRVVREWLQAHAV
jgi:uncharacterized protein